MTTLFASVASRLGGVLDDAIVETVYKRFPRKRREGARPVEPGDARERLAETIAYYGQPEVEARFFVRPPAPRVFEERRGKLPDGGSLVDLKWASPFEPTWELVREHYLAHAPNRFSHARMLRHAEAAPTIVCLHGFGGGQFLFEEHAFPSRWLYSLGLNVVLLTLPFHGKRRGEGAPMWPYGGHIPRTNEGFAHAIFDTRALIAWLDATQGREVAVIGMSLGGYTASLLATVEPLRFVVPMIPVASFPDVMWTIARGTPERAQVERDGVTLDWFRQSMRVCAPLERTPLATGERVLVVSAEGDRIAPPEHASKLAAHFSAEQLRFTGGHVLQIGRGVAFRALESRLARLGFIDRK